MTDSVFALKISFRKNDDYEDFYLKAISDGKIITTTNIKEAITFTPVYLSLVKIVCDNILINRDHKIEVIECLWRRK